MQQILIYFFGKKFISVAFINPKAAW